MKEAAWGARSRTVTAAALLSVRLNGRRPRCGYSRTRCAAAFGSLTTYAETVLEVLDASEALQMVECIWVDSTYRAQLSV